MYIHTTTMIIATSVKVNDIRYIVKCKNVCMAYTYELIKSSGIDRELA